MSACMESPYEMTVNDYVSASSQINLGMSMSEVDAILAPSQSRLKASDKKRPEKYREGNKSVDIIYYRSGWMSDGLATDDEFTPYIFNNGKLVAIGWATLGGPKTQGQARDSYSSSTSVVVY